ncbi:MAG: PKD domain-containing protein, partial [Bacteroidota bacterium]|nr:PKD domain-containing protein [Bacteroidota bacterium]
MNLTDVSVNHGLLDFTDENSLKTILDTLVALNNRDSLYFPIDSTEDECIADFSFTEDEFDEMTFEFTNKSTASTNASIILWSWDFGNGGTSSSQNPTYSYTETGSYKVTLTITDNF